MKEEIPAALDGERIDRVVSMLTGRTRAEVSEYVTAGLVHLGGRAVTSRSKKVATGQVLEVDLPPEHAAATLSPDASVAFDVVFEDEHLLVVDKPAGLVVHPGAGTPEGTLVAGVLARHPQVADVGDPARPGIVHRLDKGTSGLMVVALTQDAYDGLVAMLADHRVERRYLALAWGVLEAPAGMIDAPIGRAAGDRTRMAVNKAGREARTRYVVLDRYTHPVEVTYLECRLETGRTHQIRVHLAAIGHPIVGDARYRGDRRSFPLERPFLHAWKLGFDHPITGETIERTSPLPADLEDARGRLA